MFYLIEHNRSTKQTRWSEYNDYALAQADCLQQEQRYLLAHQNEIEVVIFEASSLDDLKRTHSRYFVNEQSNDQAQDSGAGVLLAVGLVGLAAYLLAKK